MEVPISKRRSIQSITSFQKLSEDQNTNQQIENMSMVLQSHSHRVKITLILQPASQAGSQPQMISLELRSLTNIYITS